MTAIESIFWIALCIYHESRGEPAEGQYMVAKSILNRAAERELTVKEVVFQPHQYSWTLWPDKTNVKEYGAFLDCLEIANRAVIDFVNGDNSDGVNHYFADYIEKPLWAKDMEFIAKIGKHLFYKG